ncbi:MAG: hypothetical protein ABH863_01375 [Candidatus Micrarchaeota archaeon]
MEFFIMQRANYHKLISEEDEFYYPLIFQTPLLNARYLGKVAELKLKNGRKYSGLLIGMLEKPLLEYFKEYFAGRRDAFSSSLRLQEDESEWLETHLKIKQHFTGMKYISKPAGGPYYVLLSERSDFLVFCTVSEAELDDLPEIKYNKIITNEAIEELASYLKIRLPKKLKAFRKIKGEPSLETKLKQLRISKFFKAAAEKVL